MQVTFPLSIRLLLYLDSYPTVMWPEKGLWSYIFFLGTQRRHCVDFISS